VTLRDEITKTKPGRRAWHQERAIFETTNMMCELMESARISRSELARRLGTTKGFVSQLLDGSTNMTLRTISDVFLELGCEFHPDYSRIERKGVKVSQPVPYDADHWGISLAYQLPTANSGATVPAGETCEVS
jgi:transcriptional regulator with XRE-family HTH domain